MTDVDLYTLAGTAERAKISMRQLLRMIAANEGPKITKMGRRTLIRSDHFREWLDRNARGNGSEAA